MRKCRKCKVEKDEGEFPKWGGKPGSSCAECRQQPVGGAHTKATKAKSKAKKPKPEASPAPPELSLEFPAGYGFKSRTEGGAICFEQPREDGRIDTVWLSRAEFATAIAHYGSWAGERPA